MRKEDMVMSQQVYKDLIRHLYGKINSGDYDVLDEYLAQHFIDHGKWKNRQGIKKAIKEIRAAYPGLCISIEDIIVEGDRAAVRVKAKCNDLSEFHPISAIVIFHFNDGKIMEHWGYGEALCLFR